MVETLTINNAVPMRAAVKPKLTEAQLVDDYGDSLFRFCRSITYTMGDADDLYQDTYLKVFMQMEKINKAENPQSFLFSTAAYLWKSQRRKYARRRRLAPESEIFEEKDSSPEPGMEDELAAKEEQRAVRSIVDALPDKLRLPIILCYTNELRISEIAQVLNIPAGTVMSRLHKARQVIEKGMKSHGY